jgi:hypothetical protein
VEVQKLNFATITDFSIQLFEYENLPTLLDYIQEWKISL